MTGPLDAITAIHNAFRRDMQSIDAAALSLARGEHGSETTLERFRYCNQVLVTHAHGEEIAIFPLLEEVAPLVAEAYERDHRALDEAYDAMERAVARGDALATARASSAFKFHLDVHLDKEDTHLYRIVRERVSVADQGKAVGMMAAEVPPERRPAFIAWLFPLIGHDDREGMLRVLQTALPPEAFTGVSQLVRQAIGDDWAELRRRIPELPA
jgi:hemerythrin-like domain-containing protein